jgi:hypothetical protein
MKQVTLDIAKEKAMTTIAQKELLAKIPVAELEAEIEKFVEPVTKQLPEKRLKKVVRLAVQGISAAQSPVITQMARCLQRTKEGVWAMSKRFYGLLGNERLSHRLLLKGLYAIAQRQVAQERPETLLVAIDPHYSGTFKATHFPRSFPGLFPTNHHDWGKPFGKGMVPGILAHRTSGCNGVKISPARARMREWGIVNLVCLRLLSVDDELVSGTESPIYLLPEFPFASVSSKSRAAHSPAPR